MAEFDELNPRNKARIDRSKLGLDKVPNATPIDIKTFKELKKAYEDHAADGTNPHNVTRSQLGLTTLDKSISKDTTTALQQLSSIALRTSPIWDSNVPVSRVVNVNHLPNSYEELEIVEPHPAITDHYKGSIVVTSITDESTKHIASTAAVAWLNNVLTQKIQSVFLTLRNHAKDVNNPHLVTPNQVKLNTIQGPDDINLSGGTKEGISYTRSANAISQVAIEVIQNCSLYSSIEDNSHRHIASTALTNGLKRIIDHIITITNQHLSDFNNPHKVELEQLNVEWLLKYPHYTSNNFYNAYEDQLNWRWITKDEDEGIIKYRDEKGTILTDVTENEFWLKNKANSGFWTDPSTFAYNLDDPNLRDNPDLNNAAMVATTALTFKIKTIANNALNAVTTHQENLNNPHQVRLHQVGFFVLEKIVNNEEAINERNKITVSNNKEWSLSGDVASHFKEIDVDKVNPHLRFGGILPDNSDTSDNPQVIDPAKEPNGIPNLTLINDLYVRLMERIRNLNAFDIMPIGSIVLNTSTSLPKTSSWSKIEWAWCDGRYGTIDLRGRVPVGLVPGSTVVTPTIEPSDDYEVKQLNARVTNFLSNLKSIKLGSSSESSKNLKTGDLLDTRTFNDSNNDYVPLTTNYGSILSGVIPNPGVIGNHTHTYMSSLAIPHKNEMQYTDDIKLQDKGSFWGYDVSRSVKRGWLYFEKKAFHKYYQTNSIGNSEHTIPYFIDETSPASSNSKSKYLWVSPIQPYAVVAFIQAVKKGTLPNDYN